MWHETHPLGPEVGVLGLLLAGVGAVHGVVLLQLHRLHLLLDGVHCGVCVIERRGKEAENRTRVRPIEKLGNVSSFIGGKVGGQDFCSYFVNSERFEGLYLLQW